MIIVNTVDDSIYKVRKKLQVNHLTDDIFSMVKTNMDQINSSTQQSNVHLTTNLANKLHLSLRKFLFHLEKHRCLWDKEFSWNAEDKQQARILLQSECGYKNSKFFIYTNLLK